MTYHMMNEQEKTLWIAVYAAQSTTNCPINAIPQQADNAVLIFSDRCKNGIEVKTK